MNAEPLLNSVAAALAEVRLEAILIGNAAAAIQGAPVTTVDFDFISRHTGQPRQIKTLCAPPGRDDLAPILSGRGPVSRNQ